MPHLIKHMAFSGLILLCALIMPLAIPGQALADGEIGEWEWIVDGSLRFYRSCEFVFDREICTDLPREFGTRYPIVESGQPFVVSWQVNVSEISEFGEEENTTLYMNPLDTATSTAESTVWNEITNCRHTRVVDRFDYASQRFSCVVTINNPTTFPSFEDLYTRLRATTRYAHAPCGGFSANPDEGGLECGDTELLFLRVNAAR